MKGMSPLLSGTIFVLITVVIAALVSGWLTTLTQERAQDVQNTTAQRLRCQYADLFIDEVRFSCNGNCFTGVPYSFNATIKNSGSVAVDFSDANLVYTDGTIVRLQTTPRTLNGGSTQDVGFNDIMITSVPPIPGTLTARPVSADADTRGLWRFDEGTGNFTDDGSDYGNDGNVSGALWTGGVFGSALMFNTTSFVSVQNSGSLDIINNVTVEARIKATHTDQNSAGILCKGADGAEAYCLLFDQGRITFLVRDSFSNAYTATSSQTLDDEWHHVAGVYDGSVVAVYVDSQRTDGSALSSQLRLNLANATIGNREITPNVFVSGFNGTIDDVRLSNTTRSFTAPTTVTTINLTVTVNHPNTHLVTLRNAAGGVLTQDLVFAVPFEKTYYNLPIASYRIVVEADDGTFEKWHPSQAGTCIATSTLDRVTITGTNRPSTGFFSMPGNDVTFVDCI